MSLPRHLLSRLNRAALWRRTVQLGPDRFAACSLDRLVYLWKHKLRAQDQREARFIAGLVKPGNRVVDVGANLGVYAHLLARAAGPAGEVIAFEPDAELFATLEKNVVRNGLNIRPQRKAVGATRGVARLQRGWLNSGDNRLCRDGVSAGQAAEIEIVALDEFCAGQRIDFIKMDVQGWETEALRGMRETIRANPGLTLWVELWPYGLRAAGSSAQEFLDLVAACGLSADVPLEPIRLAEANWAELAEREFWFTNLLLRRGPAP